MVVNTGFLHFGPGREGLEVSALAEQLTGTQAKKKGRDASPAQKRSQTKTYSISHASSRLTRQQQKTRA